MPPRANPQTRRPMKKPTKDGGASSSGRIADARFASFETDPRFRLPSRKHAKTTLDKRFAGMLDDQDFVASAKVDRYGRTVHTDAKKRALQRLYRTEDDEQAPQHAADEPRDDDTEDDDDDVDDDELVQRELLAAHERATQRRHDPARQGGFSSSESDSDDDSSEDQDDEDQDEDRERGGVGAIAQRHAQRRDAQQAEVESGDVTSRLAIVNLDWDHVNSTDLMALFSSFVQPSAGRILKISVYPSEFGKERMQQEEVEGPPKALFKDEAQDESDSSDSDGGSDSGDEEIKKELITEGDDQDFDSDALRSYQLDRLRYYYAVMVCSSPEVAKSIYEATDGTEYQSSSNVIDLRFVPDDVSFDDEARDECSKAPDAYKPVDFVTNALQSSKVKLTWDMHPEEASRKDSINRAFSGSRNELEENDLRAYLASDSDGEDKGASESEGVGDDEGGPAEPKLSKKELARRKMRQALGLADEAAPSRAKDGPVGEMQITFAPALAEGKAKEPEQAETTIDKYKRKERERKERKRQDAKARREADSQGGDVEKQEKQEQQAPQENAEDDAGFDDPFFTTDQATVAPSKTSMRNEERRKKRKARQAAEAEKAKQTAQLAKVMAEDAGGRQASQLEHFDMNEIVRAEKAAGKKARRKKKETSGRDGLQQGFEMDVDDKRFDAVFASHEFAIDPSNPKFKATGGMKKLLEEGRKKRKAGDSTDKGEGVRREGKRAKRAGR